MHPLFGRKWFSWPRLACLLVTVLLLVVVFRQIDPAAVWASLRRLSPPWFGLAIAAYGVALGLAGVRSHFGLRLTDQAIHLSASCRSFIVGHFFFVALFGAVGGDLAKSAVYARWYGLAFPEVLAAASVDRILGLGGTLLLAGMVLLISGANHGFTHWQSLDFHPATFPGRLALILILALAFAAFFGRQRWRSPWSQAWRAFRSGTARLFSSPSLAVPGFLFALLSQLALSAVFALNLQAVTATPLPWGQIAWTIPAITLLSCLPFTVAGAGAREAAAIAFLSLYGISTGDAVAASLMTLLQKMGWGFIGAVVLWREESRVGRCKQVPRPQTISVVIPALNEADHLAATISSARAIPEVKEIIVVDGGSRDATRAVAEQLGCRVLGSEPSRGRQMRLGASHASGDVVLLLHADTWLPPNAGRAALNCLRDPTVVAGGFWKVFRNTPWLLLGSRWKCAVRLFLGRRIAGDQALFIRREVLEQIGGVPDMHLMEEFELCRRLRQVGRLALADATLVTSARRFEKLGVLRTYFRMWYITNLYRLGMPPHKLSHLYDKK